MYKVFIWGTGSWGEKCFQDLLPGVEVIGFVESSVGKKSFQGKKVIAGQELLSYDYDYLILANTHEEEIMRDFPLNKDKVLIYRRRERPDGARLFNYQVIDEARGQMPYLSVECDGLVFVYNKTDIMIPEFMYCYQTVWSKEEMEFFWREAPRRQKGIFMDIGANIGTTSIHFRKNLAPDFTYIAFEPVKENYKICKMNCILNECEDIVVENLGISDTDGQRGLMLAEVNYGACRVTDSKNGEDSCTVMRLDTYVKEHGISPKDISYIWMDIECHEASAISGAKEILLESDASLFMEYNAAEYKIQGKLESILEDLAGIYDTFICFEQYIEGKTQKRRINELADLADEMDWRQCNVLFMKNN